jgi:hypothetical protein
MLDPQHDVGHAAPDDGRTREARYHRLMPGGGYVAIEMVAVQASDAPTPTSRGRLLLERRADQGRRTGHAPPVVAELAGEDADALIAELFRLAHDNAALARGLMQWQSARLRAD